METDKPRGRYRGSSSKSRATSGTRRASYGSSRMSAATEYPPRRASNRRSRPRHAKSSLGIVAELAQALSRWLARVGAGRNQGARARSARSRVTKSRSTRTTGRSNIIWLKRMKPFLASARRYSSYLSAVVGVVIILFSVYLLRQGVMLPSSVPFGGTSAVSQTNSGGDGQTEATTGGTGDTGGAEGTAGSGQTAGTGDTSGTTGGTTDGTTDAATGQVTTGPESQPVAEQEGPGSSDSVEVGPRSVGEILGLIKLQGGGDVLRPFGWYESAVFEDWRYHTGADVAFTAGDFVRAAGPGMVVTVEGTAVDGWRVVISHGLGVTTVYSQLGSASVSEGDEVAAGEPIGLAGAPGTLESDLAVHLHFELRVDGSVTDPTPYLGR